MSCVTGVAQGQRLISLDRAVVDRLRAMRDAGELFSDVILRIAGRGRARHDEQQP